MSVPSLTALTLREWRTWWTDRGAYILRSLYASALLVGVGLAWLMMSDSGPSLLRSLFGWFCRGQFVLATALASLTFARSICREQERGTLDLLLLSPLTKLEILLAKLIGEFLGLATLVLAGLPMVLLLIPLGGVTPSEILTVQGILLAHLLAVGGLTVTLAAVLGRAAPVMFGTWAAVAFLALGPGWARALVPGGWRIWNALEPISALNLLELQLGTVSAHPALAGQALLAAVLVAFVFCALGSLMLERRYVEGGRASGGLSLARWLRRVSVSPRAAWIFRPWGPRAHPLVERELALDRDPWFRVSCWLLVLGYAWVVRRELLTLLGTWDAHAAIAAVGTLIAAVLTIVLGALRVGGERRRGILQTLLAAGVSPEDLLRSRLRGLLKRAAWLLTLPILHASIIFAHEVPGSAWWRIPAFLIGVLVGTVAMAGITLRFALGFRRAELAAFAALIVAIPAFVVVATTLSGHVLSLALGLPVVLGLLLSGYARLIRRVPQLVLG
jgi:ABC-type transport system involved in multi-copper enzyme maturation permease subunit